jgi:hypothetical protein
MAKRFFYVSAAMLCLMLSYHFGARSATAQAPSNAVVAVFPGPCPESERVVVTANGDLWGTTYCAGSWTRIGNVFSGGPTPAQQESFGRVKARYR